MTDQPQADGEQDFFDQLVGGDARPDLEAYETFMALYRQTSKLGSYPASTWISPGNVSDYQAYSGGVRFSCANGVVSVDWQGQNCIRVWYTIESPDVAPFSYATVPPDSPTVQFQLLERDDYLIIQTETMQITIQFYPFQLSVQSVGGETIYSEDGGIQRHPSGNVRLLIALYNGEMVYGLGERAAHLNLRGGRYTLWNVDQPNCDLGTDPLYYCVPFIVGQHAGGNYGVFFDNAYRGVVDVGAVDESQLQFEFEGGEGCYYLTVGDSPLDVVATYTRLTGFPPLPPLWYFGYHQSRFSYRTHDELLSIADQMREHRIPCDALYLDIHYMNGYRVFTWDQTAYRNPVATIREINKRGFQVVPIVDPGIKVDTAYGVYERGLEQSTFLLDDDGNPIRALIWAGVSYMPDFSDPNTRQWWANEAAAILETGIGGIWNDMNEPAVFTTKGANTLPERVSHSKEGYGGKHLELHNLYGMLMSRASFEAQQQHRPHQRPVNITRAGYAGTQRYATSWTGDVSSEWEHLRMCIPMMLNLGMSGVPFTGPDVGGFRGDTTGELLTRWTQVACLMPFFRNHSAIDTVRQEPWSFGEPFLSHIREAIELRYRLMPYVYAVAAQATAYGYPMVRPISAASPQENALWGVDDAFMLGDAVLVAPVLQEGARQRDVRLPLGVWYDFWTGDTVLGGSTINVEASLGHLPMFVRGGAVLPQWELRQNVQDGMPDNLTLTAYPGKLDMMLYEDAGVGLDYQQGAYRWIALSTYWYNNRLHIKRRTTGGYEPPYEKIRVRVMGFEKEPLVVRVDDQGAPVWYYEDGIVELTTDEFELLEITRQVGPSDETIIGRARF